MFSKYYIFYFSTSDACSFKIQRIISFFLLSHDRIFFLSNFPFQNSKCCSPRHNSIYSNFKSFDCLIYAAVSTFFSSKFTFLLSFHKSLFIFPFFNVSTWIKITKNQHLTTHISTFMVQTSPTFYFFPFMFLFASISVH